jgi:hypothetical protein
LEFKRNEERYLLNDSGQQQERRVLERRAQAAELAVLAAATSEVDELAMLRAEKRDLLNLAHMLKKQQEVAKTNARILEIERLQHQQALYRATLQQQKAQIAMRGRMTRSASSLHAS